MYKRQAFPPHALAQNQVVKTLNALHEKIGISRAPGYAGIVASSQVPVFAVSSYWPGDDNPNDIVGGADAGWHYPGQEVYVPGKVNDCFSNTNIVTGSFTLTIPNNSLFNFQPTDKFYLSFWFQLVNMSSDWIEIVGRGDMEWGIVRDNDGFLYINRWTAKTSGKIINTNWHFIEYDYDNGMVNVNLDNSNIFSGSGYPIPAGSTSDLGFLKSAANVQALLDEVKITSYKGGQYQIVYTPLFQFPIRGWFQYVHSNGTQTAIAVSNEIVYSVDVSAGTATQIGTINGDGECYAVNAAGKLWIVNGSDFIKVEDDLSVYRVQILAPATGTATGADSGGSLLAGIYGCYVAYARVVNGQYLYSLPISLGNVTLTGGNSLINFSVPASTDPQVTHKVVFMTDASGAVPYRYGVFTNATVDFTVLSNINENQDILMSTVSANNQVLPIIPSGIFTFNNMLLVWVINGYTVYWSLMTDVNPFDMERFLPQNFRTVTYGINAIFSVAANLYLNHISNGITTIANGDMSSVFKNTDRTHWFLDCKTPEGKSNVVMHLRSAFGLTNDGFRFYMGGTFSTAISGNYYDNFTDDLSFFIKPDINKVYQGIGSDNLPCAIVNRRANKRTEYRFSFRNLDYNSYGNNDQLIFNLDFYLEPQSSQKTWERWEGGFASMMILNNTFYGAQNGQDGQAQIVKENRTADINCYDRKGNFLQTTTNKQLYILSRTHVDALESVGIFGPIYALAMLNSIVYGNVILLDKNYDKFPFTLNPSPQTGGVLPPDGQGGLPIPFIMTPQQPLNTIDSISFEARSNAFSIELSQVADDPDFFLYKITLPRVKQITNNMT